MATKTTKEPTLKLPTSLSIKDIITIISVAVSITLAWGVFSTRITVLEKEVVMLQADSKDRNAEIGRIYERVRKLELREQDDATLIDQIFFILKRPAPPRHSDN